jgi:hypothetical protein
VILIPFPAAFNLAVRAQLKRVLKSSETEAAAELSEPPMVPGLGAASGMVNTMGSGVGVEDAEGFAGVMIEFLGKSM